MKTSIYTVEERKELYQQVIDLLYVSIIINEWPGGVCNILCDLTGTPYYVNGSLVIEFPELMLFKEVNHAYWLTFYDDFKKYGSSDKSGKLHRINVLLFCIEMCNDELNQN